MHNPEFFGVGMWWVAVKNIRILFTKRKILSKDYDLFLRIIINVSPQHYA